MPLEAYAREKKSGKGYIALFLLASVLHAASSPNERRPKQAAGEQIPPLRAFPERLNTATAVAAAFIARLGPARSLSAPH